MKRKLADPMLRWCDRDPHGQTAEDEAAALIRGSLQPGEPGELPLARIEQRLSRPRRLAVSRPGLRLALAFVFLVASAASVEAARRMGWLEHILPTRSPEPIRPQSPRSPARMKVAVHVPPASVDLPAPAAEPPPAPAVVIPAVENQRPPRPTRLAHRLPPVEKTEPATPAAEPASSEEISALDRAIRLLRRQRDAAGALAALDDYLDRYPQGVLNREARFARVDALLILQRPKQALEALENLPLDQHRRSTELQVIRGELRAHSDCAAAGRDFSSVLARDPDDLLAERALYGRGACRVKLGDEAGAIQDLRRYLERFPKSAHATWARRWLESRSQ